ncbi:hypothetical protein TPHA_0C00790 [Tetrapisispora phaffii CBS 4417]|uniref:U6 snRNA phosphodiesterase 1 n=1 Tax=Tetrapisispora phaffii (strain ATCC 24235 / CBS 4417 / NBRC 1672 / NRRL Y-8282 / UCD 70-5) TaxID=1071381 RepID=G8BR59_TETPH|nr:hypothetical protein TPHA_0C00790 [Tetrapisispora phaffii CBS 4417]CCE62235.1 hypothetical protein TPHA_0C00790 [Tetrapisispora phaffii CBS 4417]
MDLLRDNYSDSDRDSDDEEKRAQDSDVVVPELSEAVLDKYNIAPSVSRLYSRRDSQGMFNGFINIQYRTSTEMRMKLLHNIVKINSKCNTKLEPLFFTELGSPAVLHISLSQNLFFQSQEQRNSFYRLLEQKIHTAEIRPFDVKFDARPIWFAPLDTKRKTLFLVYKVEDLILESKFKPLQNCINRSLREIFPDKRIKEFEVSLNNLHMSIAKMLDTPDTLIRKYNKKTMDPFLDPDEHAEEFMVLPSFTVKQIKCDVNRKVINIKLLHPQT